MAVKALLLAQCSSNGGGQGVRGSDSSKMLIFFRKKENSVSLLSVYVFIFQLFLNSMTDFH
jgi:hypothetical protein